MTTPLIPLFASIARDEAKPIDYIGLLGELVMETSNTQTGQVEINYEKRLITLSVKAVEEQEGMMKRGTEVVITYHDKVEEIYYVRPVSF